ncbi:MAG: rane protein [Bacillota bacterium]|nr:rane protein [Bacillota bacterium]
MKKVVSIFVSSMLILSAFTGTVFAGQGNGNGGNGNSSRPGNNWSDSNWSNGNWGEQKSQKVNKEFKDMRTHWGKKSVEKVQNLGIFGGYADGTFQPDKALTQAELAVIIDRLLQLKDGDGEDTDFEGLVNWSGGSDSDIPGWAKKSVAKGLYKHYFNINRFHSQVQVDRLTACVALAKALDLEPVTDFTGNPFTDRGLISDEDYGYLLALFEEGYISGYPNGAFNPYSFLSRAQMAAIIEKLLDEINEDTDDTEEDLQDETAPEWSSSSVTATAIKATSVELEWSGAKDDVKVVGYKVLYELDGTDKVKNVTGRSVTITGLEADEEYTFTVEAKDAAGNWSNDGPSVTVTLPESDDDTEAPAWSKDAALTVSRSSSGLVTLIWPDAEDDNSIASYKIYKDGELVKTVNGDVNSINISGLEEDKEYTFKVKSIDEAGNVSTSLSKTYLVE